MIANSLPLFVQLLAGFAVLIVVLLGITAIVIRSGQWGKASPFRSVSGFWRRISGSDSAPKASLHTHLSRPR